MTNVCSAISVDDVTLTTFDGHTDGVVSVRFSPGGTKMVSTSYDSTVRVVSWIRLSLKHSSNQFSSL
jgi:WD40 repeat protein